MHQRNSVGDGRSLPTSSDVTNQWPGLVSRRCWYTSTGLAFLLTSPAHSAAMLEWMATTYSNALDSPNTRLMTSPVGTGRLSVKWSSQARALDK
ncbi:hypothetical protein TNCV_1244581 [Trichonephila clavipes]|nr:hypothetical protein TNCV_1244581 [Trichonephila clavipes]